MNFINVCIDIYVMMSSDLYGTCRHCLYGTLSHLVQRRHNCNPFGNIATVTSHSLLHHARHCFGHKWLMDQMCSKCKKHCFSHALWKNSELQNFGKFPKKFFLSEFVFFIEFFFDKNVFLTDNFFQRIFIALKTIALY